VQTRKQVRVFQGHTASPRCVAFSPDGKFADSSGDDRSLRVWDVAGGAELPAPSGHADAVTSVVWSGDGRHVLSGSRDGTLRWWNVASRKQVFHLEGHAGPVLSVALAPDGKTALSGGNDRTVRLWSVESGKELHCFQGHAQAVVQVQFHTGGREFYSSGSQHQSSESPWHVWDLTDRKETGSMTAGPEYRFGCAIFSTDGRHVLAGGPGGFLRVWNMPAHPAPASRAP
jgi:WD40 repeat protein